LIIYHSWIAKSETQVIQMRHRWYGWDAGETQVIQVRHGWDTGDTRVMQVRWDRWDAGDTLESGSMHHQRFPVISALDEIMKSCQTDISDQISEVNTSLTSCQW